jgi:predicted DNA-binding protein (UPF0251 family)
MSNDDLQDRAWFVVRLFRECDAIQLPHKPTEEVLLGMIARIDELEAMQATSLEALELADAALSGANMNMAVMERKVKAAIAKLKGEKNE